MMALDTGLCAPESIETLRLQQWQLIRGKRNAQMFPKGTIELNLPDECERYENNRGIYHFRNVLVETIMLLSKYGRENEILMLGPFSKYDIAVRLRNGEASTCITEYISGTELRCAIGTNRTIHEQHKYFETTKEPNGVIVVGECPERVTRWLAANEAREAMNYAI
jgi:hypothetical protein